MLFNSYIFIFLFLPLALTGWYVLNHFNYKKMAQGYLIGMSLWFYSYFNADFLWVIMGSCVFNYLLSFLIEKKSEWKKGLLVAGCIGNTGALGVFKYTGFLVENINILFSSDFNVENILLPLGISFITFQQLSFIIDRYKGKIEHCQLIDYLSFVTFFPSLVSGPIVLHGNTIGQFRDYSRRKIDTEQFAKGIIQFVIGLSKKVLLADTLALGVNYGFSNIIYLDSTAALLVALMYTLELYFDFSGYSDMAVGIGRMFGIDLPENFNSPYKAATVKDFWRRWHMTLSNFLQNYVYISLGGNRKGKVRTCVNTMITFLVSGLWHGADWTFIFWGFLHGAGTIASGFIKMEKMSGIKKKILQVLTFIYVCTAFVFFRADSMSDGFTLFRRIFAFEYYKSIIDVAAAMEPSEVYVVIKALSLIAPGYIYIVQILLMAIVLFVSWIVIRGKKTIEIAEKRELKSGFIFGLAFLFVWSILSMSGVSSFVYFDF